MLKYLLESPYPSFKLKNLRGYFTTSFIIKGFFIAFCLSLPIYLAYFEFKNEIFLKIINSISALVGFYLLLKSKREVLFWSGAFVGVLWFYWIALSFRYYDVAYLMPLMVLFVMIGYGLIFWIIGLFSPPIRALLFGVISFVHPLNFNWFVPEILFLDSYFGVEKIRFTALLLAISLFVSIKNRYRYLVLIPVLALVQPKSPTPTALPKQKIYLSSPKTPQDLKWKDSYRGESIDNNFKIIKKAIKEGYDIVVLSESAFALFLNTESYLMQELKNLSQKITIVTGGLYFDGKDSYNSTYYFQKGEVMVANKVVLVPFGEEIPLPKFISRYINKIIYDGAEDYIAAKRPVDIKIGDESFRNAICYEATRDELYLNNPKYMIAISNNAWFTPSIEPTLQHMLLRYFSRIHHTTIFHSANMAKTAVIRG